MFRRLVLGLTALALCPAPAWADSLSLEQAMRRAMSTNPRIGEASANRRAVDYELRQVQGGLLPQVRLTAEWGDERLRQFDTFFPNNDWRVAGGQAGVVVRQLVYDGGQTLNEIYRQMARSDSAAHRVRERSEIVALDAAEAYLNILRYEASLEAARRNIALHSGFLRNVQARFSAGRTGNADLQQVRERLSGATALQAELRVQLEDAKAAYRAAVGQEPGRVTFPGRLSGLPATREAALQRTVQQNATLLAAQSDIRVAQRQFDAAAGAYGPTVALEVRNTHGRDNGFRTGAFDETSAKVVATWSLFDGGTNAARRSELAERVGEQQMRLSSLHRSAFQSIDRAWGARERSGQRVAALQAQVAAAERVVAAYRSEYELGTKSILDLLNAGNAVLNARLSLAAARSVSVLADYQLIAATGDLMPRLSAPLPREAEPTPPAERHIVDVRPVVDPAIRRAMARPVVEIGALRGTVEPTVAVE